MLRPFEKSKILKQEKEIRLCSFKKKKKIKKKIQECQRASSQTGVKTTTPPARSRGVDEVGSNNPNTKLFSYRLSQPADAKSARRQTTLNSTSTHTTCRPCPCFCEIDTRLSFTGVLKRIISLLAATNETSTAVASTAVGAEATFLFG